MKREGLLDLNEAVQNPGKKLEFTVSTSLENEESLDLLAPIAGTVRAVSTGNLLLVSATFTTRAVFECARCGEPIEHEFEFNMSDEFAVEGVPASYSRDGYAHVVEDEPEPLFKANAIIIDHYVRQGLIINTPTQLLCTGTWENPCSAGATTPPEEPAHGHPAFEALKSLSVGDGQ